MPDTAEVVIVDAAGTEHVFPPGFDPKKAGDIVRAKTAPSEVAPSLADRAKAAFTKQTAAPLSTAVASAAVPAARATAERLATNPKAWKVGKVIGELLGLAGGGAAGASLGAAGGVPGSVAGGMVGAANGMWAGGRAGWRLTNAAQRLAAPVSKLLTKLEPYSLPMAAMSAEGDALQALNDPKTLAELLSHQPNVRRILGLPEIKAK